MISLAYNKAGLEVYYILVALIAILGFTKYSLTKGLGLSFEIFKNKSFYYFIIPAVALSNTLLALLQKFYWINETQSINTSLVFLILNFLIFNSIRTFGEEFIFRAFLLVKEVNSSNAAFWVLNSVQAFLFSSIHFYFVIESDGRFIFGIYVFILSLFLGWMNRKFNSIVPSWIIHWINGLQTLVIAAISYI